MPDRKDPWQQFLQRDSFIERSGRDRALALLDPDSARELCGPFDRVESPWLEPQGLVPQEDDGMIVMKGTLDGDPCVVLAIEQAFQGGSTGEVSGAKAAAALELAARDARGGAPISAVLVLETGGVRLQEANLGLNAVAEICATLLELRALRPVVGVICGPLGSFGGMSIAAGLCTRLVMTNEGRLGLNGPEVIESEAGVEEFDSEDRTLVWAVDGGRQRHETGLVDALVTDDAAAIRDAVIAAVAAGVPPTHRSEDLETLRRRLTGVSDDGGISPEALRSRWSHEFGTLPPLAIEPAPTPADLASPATDQK